MLNFTFFAQAMHEVDGQQYDELFALFYLAEAYSNRFFFVLFRGL